MPLALLLGLGLPRPAAKAEDYLDYKYEEYAEEGGRIAVHTQGLSAHQELGPDTAIGLTVLNDAIAGASPTGQPAPAGSSGVPLANVSDHRKAWELDGSQQWRNVNVALGISDSREHDYTSRGWSLNTLTDLNQKNTEVLAGIAGHRDWVETFYDSPHVYLGKQAVTAIVGLRQLLSPATFFTVNFSGGRETGDLNDQYKGVEKTVAVSAFATFPLFFAENRPGERDFGVFYAALNHNFAALHGALETSYRYYADTYGINAHTLQVRWLQKLGSRVTLSPDVRWTRERAANFYYYDLDATSLVPTTAPDSKLPAYSSDYRLSAFDALAFGAQLSVRVTDQIQLNCGAERYAMRGRDGVTPQSAYPVARIWTAGTRISW